MYLLDTNICIAILKRNKNVLNNFSLNYQQTYISTLVLAELYKGVYCSTKVEKNLVNLGRFISTSTKLIVHFENIKKE